MATVVRRIKKVKVSGGFKIIYLVGGLKLKFKAGFHPAYPEKRDLVRIDWGRPGAGKKIPSIEITRRGCSQAIFREAELSAELFFS